MIPLRGIVVHGRSQTQLRLECSAAHNMDGRFTHPHKQHTLQRCRRIQNKHVWALLSSLITHILTPHTHSPQNHRQSASPRERKDELMMHGVLLPRAMRGVSSTARRASSLASAVAGHRAHADAVLAPQQGIAWTYGELDEKARCLAAGLEDIGYKPGDVAISDVPNVAENLLLQCALGHLGAAICTPPKDAAAFEKLVQAGHKIRGVICVDGANPPDAISQIASSNALPLAYLSVTDGCRPPSGSVALDEFLAHCPPRGAPPAATEGSTLGIFGGAALTHGDALALGQSAVLRLGMSERDRVCCSVTLMHAFGIGSACSSALVSGGAVVLPAVGGIKGCGDPNQRASVTLEVLTSAKATIMFGDSHTLKALKALDATLLPPASDLALRTGVVKIGSGSDFLDGVAEIPAPAKGGGEAVPLEFMGVTFHAMGKKVS